MARSNLDGDCVATMDEVELRSNKICRILNWLVWVV